ncbi:MAG: glycosyltransferase family 4 protein [Flavobacteriales bacterium]
MKVCHLTSVHTRYDTRIFLKECSSLAANGYEVSLIVADDLGDESKSGVNILDVGKNNSARLSRFTKTTRKVYRKAIRIDADIYHFHDSELMPFAYLLKLKGKKVIYDAHEDLPRQLLSKPYLGKVSKKILSFLIEKIENFFASRFTAIITATPFIRERFLKLNNHTIDINNFPLLGELHDPSNDNTKINQVCYVGGISEIRGIESLINACEKINGTLVLAGKFTSQDLEQRIRSLKGWKNVDYRGLINREEVKQLFSESKAGIVTFLDEPNHINSQPNKMFEYMSAQLPVICSHFELWKSIIEVNNCGFCIEPNDTDAISNKINLILDDDSKVSNFGKNGRKAVVQKFNWSIEESKLLKLYKNL